MSQIIAEKVFSVTDQAAFAAISGDRNPIHMDAGAARRTVAGFPVVHGIHAVLWGLDNLYQHIPDLPLPTNLIIRFGKMIHVNDLVRLEMARGQHVVLDLTIDGVPVVNVTIKFKGQQPAHDLEPNGDLFAPDLPLDLTFEEAVTSRGRVSIAHTSTTVAKQFPAAAEALGNERISSLARSSFLIGMVCPGLHSIYSSAELALVHSPAENSDFFGFRVLEGDARFRMLKLAVSGGGWQGFLEAFVRSAPVAQPSLSLIAKLVSANEFAGANALVVGGSRGLGEVIAKILLSGGARVTVTYATGEADASRLQSEVRARGGQCDILCYDVRQDAGAQLAKLRAVPDQLYYLATPPIFRRRATGFSQSRFEDFLDFYVRGFYDICRELRSNMNRKISTFYPSTIALESRPPNMTEYAMAKAAGEMLCADMQKFENFGPVLVQRLPRLLTDQTATISPVTPSDTVDAMLSVVREVHAAASRGS